MLRFASLLVPGCVLVACGGQGNANAPAPAPTPIVDAGSSVHVEAETPPPDAGPVEPARVAAQGKGACPDWLPSSHASFERFRAKATPAFPKGAASCCAVTTQDVLCRVGVNANHVVGAMSGSSLVGVTEGVAAPWLDVPLDVASHGSMKVPDAPLVRIGISVSGTVVTLTREQGTCPRACARGSNACRGAEADASRACEAIGSYDAGRAAKRP